jgi:DNA-binding MarR family transcriptional regulator
VFTSARHSLDNLVNEGQGTQVDRIESFPGAEPYGAGERELLRAVRELVRADQSMRRSLSRRMVVGETDLRALRHVMAAARLDRPVTPRDLAEHLGISTASTTAMLDRLCAAGHLERAPHPADARSKVVSATEHAYDEVRSHLSETHDRMRAVAAEVPASARPAVLAFLDALTDVMLSDGESA